MQSLFGFVSGASAEVEIALQDDEKRKQVSFKGGDRPCPLYFDGESVAGKVNYWLIASYK